MIGGGALATPSGIYRTIRQALRRRQQIVFTYHGKPRAACPIVLGYSADGRVGFKTNDNLALLAALVAFFVAIFISAAFMYLIVTTARDWLQNVIAHYRIENLEDAISLFKKNFYEEISGIKFRDEAAFKYSFMINHDVLNSFASDTNNSLKDLLDQARSQPIKASIAFAIQQAVKDLIDSRTRYYLFLSSPKNPNKLIDFEKETISLLISSRFRTELSSIVIGVPLLILALDIAFVCAGPLRTMLQKWL
jgi:hypothetical protein